MNTVQKYIDFVSEPLTYICNKIIIKWNVSKINENCSKVIPLSKACDKKPFSNYRPVSFLPQFSKVLEKIMYARLISFIESNNVICSGQYGFREKRATSMTLIELLENITYNCDKKMVAAMVIDLKKAFDTVNHAILFKNYIIMELVVLL